MKAWLARLFGSSTQQEPQDAPDPVTATAQAADAAPTDAEVATQFFRHLAGGANTEPQPQLEAVILDALKRLAASPDAGASLVPRVPAVIPQLLRSLRDDSVTGADLARQLAQDVVLVAEVIREANSPFYRPATPIKTIEGAVMLLGQNGMRMLLARVAFRPIISQQSGKHASQLAPQVWRQSELCALAAGMLAARLTANPFEAYLAGLMENVGLMVALRAIDQIHAEPLLPQSDGFIAALHGHARDMSARIATLWDFPATVTSAIRSAGGPSADPLARTLALADRIAKLRLLADGGVLTEDDAAIATLTPDARGVFDKLRSEEE